MIHETKSVLSMIFTVAFLSFATAPAESQTPLAGFGHGSYLNASGQNTLHFTYFLAQRRNGTVRGYAVWRGPNSIIGWRVDSVMMIGATQAFAGPIAWVLGTPPAGYEVGVTAFTAVNDFGRGSADQIASLSVVPSQLGNPSIQQIIAFTGPPPPAAFRPLLAGNIWIH